jgi:hypothetical protein
LSHHLIFLIAQHLFEGVVDIKDVAGGINQHQALFHVFNDALPVVTKIVLK